MKIPKLIFFFCACVSSCLSTPKKREEAQLFVSLRELQDKETHRSVNFKLPTAQKKVFLIILESQPGTGYSWREIHNTSPAILKKEPEIVNRDYLPGGFSDTLFTYEAKEKGSGEIVFSYRQHWQKEDPYEKILRLKINME
ncbi:MAG: protease inhibitor I42 family protein [Leptospiraceae bacterium]|nr:protease inhibitor I42 family protein [Leptospiraceae bacterium]MDW8305977.1 protease inhibitor I42 family protein [Leptospiraceae bacterium]